MKPKTIQFEVEEKNGTISPSNLENQIRKEHYRYHTNQGILRTKEYL